MARTIIPLNRDWTYVPSWKPEWASSPVPSGKDGEAVVDLPHTNRMLPFNNFDENSYQFVSCYQKRIAIPFGEKVYLDFEGIASCSEVYVEGEKVISHE
jgi:beta-galactosidase